MTQKRETARQSKYNMNDVVGVRGGIQFPEGIKQCIRGVYLHVMEQYAVHGCNGRATNRKA